MRLAALVLLLAQNACADELGRLFFTPEQRVQLEQRHATNASGVPPSAPRLNGVVQKHGGARTVWIDGVTHSANEEAAPDAASVNVRGNSLLLKVGQRPAPATGNE